MEGGEEVLADDIRTWATTEENKLKFPECVAACPVNKPGASKHRRSVLWTS